jgi:hypothetical protein
MTNSHIIISESIFQTRGYIAATTYLIANGWTLFEAEKEVNRMREEKIVA